MTLAALLLLAAQCAPDVAPATLAAIVRVESAGDPGAIGVNGRTPRALRPLSRADALAAAATLQRQGADFDLGLAQINVRNLAPLGMSLADAFNPCRNLAAGARILHEGYVRSLGEGLAPKPALRAALSCYNTGDRARGLANGYVARVYRAATQIVPQIDPADRVAPADAPGPPPVTLRRAQEAASDPPSPALQPAPSLDVFDQTNRRVLVFPPAPPSGRAVARDPSDDRLPALSDGASS